MTTLMPATAADVAALVIAARAEKNPLEITGGETRIGLGRPVQAARTLSTRALTGITLYEPSEMVIAARAGTPLAEVEAALAEKGQRLPFEPMDHRPLMGTTGEPTVGGLVAANVSGPRRIQAGACRDALIGVRVVTGRGEEVSSGGRVMKNVTGYDLVKLMAGAYGTLGIITDVTFRVLPVTETETTLVLEGLDDTRAVAALSAGLGSPFEVTGAAHLPARDGTPARTLLRIEGFASSVDYRAGALNTELRAFGSAQRMDVEESRALWRDIRDARPLAAAREKAVWRLSTAPTRAPAVIAALASVQPDYFCDWGGGLIWVAVEAGHDAQATAIRTAVKTQSGHVTLIRAPDSVRNGVDVLQPLQPALMDMTRKIKSAFDPDAILNPGRMYAGV